MKGKLVYPYTDKLLQYEFLKGHPLKPDRLKLTYLLSEQLGLLEHVKQIETEPVLREELETFHSPEFIDAVIKASDGESYSFRHGLGTADNPLFPDMYDAAARYVGATLDAMKEIEKGASNAFVISGGLHHSHRSEASGFCIFNDVVIAVNHLRKKKPCKVLYLDIFDAHHGDGVQNAFYGSKEVMTISMHQSGKTLFPGTGHLHEIGTAEGTGYAVNIPLQPGASSKELETAFNEIVKPLFESFNPDLLVTQLGVDGHFLDPLAQLSFSTDGFEKILNKLKDLASNMCDIGWLAVGGGGYHPVNVARLWTLFLALMLDEKVPEKIPEDFKNTCREMGYSDIPEGMRDAGEVIQQFVPRKDVELDLDRTIRRIQELVFLYHGL
ncbi:MAG: acetoin utilization protein AcuC [Candidatus Thorarchaeota archaeon]